MFITLASLIQDNGSFKLPASPRVIQSSSRAADRPRSSLIALARLTCDVQT